MKLPDNCVRLIFTLYTLIIFPSCRICAVKINDHSSHTVYTSRTCININGFVCCAVCGYKIGVVSACQIAGNCDRPYALTALCHILGFNDSRSAFGVTAGFIAFDLYCCGCRCPDLECCGCFAVVCPKIISTVCILVQCGHF